MASATSSASSATATRSTLGEILRILNEDNRISIFGLIGRHDLMADAF
jgi:hypothetical protein